MRAITLDVMLELERKCKNICLTDSGPGIPKRS